MSVNRRPDENLRYKTVISHALASFKKHDLDGVYIFTNASGRSAHNLVQKRVVPLSRALSGLVLQHHYGSLLDDNANTLNTDMEMTNFEYAGETIVEIWSEMKINRFNVIVDYIRSPENIGELQQIADQYWYLNLARQSQNMFQVLF